MASAGAHLKEDLIRYLDGELTGDELRRIREHLAACVDCRELFSFSETFTKSVSKITAEEFMTKEPCPDTWFIAGLVEGEIDEETARHVRAHLLFCDECSEMYFAAKSLRGPSWTRVVLRALEGLWDSLSVTGAGQILQPAAAAGPVRGEVTSRMGTARIEAAVVDPETGMAATVRLIVNASPSKPEAAIVLEAQPPPSRWKVTLLDDREEEIAGMPLTQGQTALASRLPFGDYFIRIHKGEDRIATFELDIRAR